MGKYFSILVFTVCLWGCGEDVDLFVPRPSQVATGDIDRLMTQLREDFQPDISHEFKCPCIGNRAYEVDQDVVIEFPYNFANLSQYPCVDGQFTVQTTILDTRGEILVAGIPTVSGSDLLDARVQCNIVVNDGTQHVQLDEGKALRLLINDPDPRERMELFYGQGDGWVQADGDPQSWLNVHNAEWFIQDTAWGYTIEGSGYETFCDSLYWVGTSVMLQIPENYRTAVCVDLPDGFTGSNTAVFVVLDYAKTVIRLSDTGGNSFCTPTAMAPKGQTATIIAMTEWAEGDYRFAMSTVDLAADHVEVLDPLKIPYEELLQFLKEL